MNYYERHLGDYARDAGHLSMLEHGAYTLLLDRYYTTGQPIPEGQAHRLCRAFSDAERSAVDAVLAEFFVLEDGLWRNRRADEELVKAQVRIENARNNGRKGGRKPKANPAETQREPSGLGLGTPDLTQSKAHQAPPNHLSTTEAKATVEPAVRLPDRFPEFWSAYPNKQGKQEAWKRWKRDKLDAIADTILAHVARMRAEDDGWQRGYAPMGSTYLNQARWTDEPRAAPSANHQPSKTMGGLLALEAMKNGLATNGSNHRAAEAALPLLGAHAGSRDANGHGDCVDGEFVEVVVAPGARHTEDS